jgi:hypothetical protein
MRVKLSYTAEVEEIFSEAAFLLTRLGEGLQRVVDKYNETLIGLREENPNLFEIQAHIDIIRTSFASMDTRLEEVSEILLGYEEYKLKLLGGLPLEPANINIPQTEALLTGEKDD